MGWTSVEYKKASHTTMTAQDAFDFINQEYWDYPIAMWHFKGAKDQWEHNEFYCIMQSPQGKNFIMTIIIDIKNNEIYWKEIEESMGPIYYNCPKEFFKFVTTPNDYARSWRTACIKTNVKYNKIEV